jgi:hypothetical protein
MNNIVKPILGPTHTGMRNSAIGILGRIRDAKSQNIDRDLKFMAGELLKHLQELSERYYAGDITVVDEFLQLYDLAQSRPKID